MLKKAFQKLLFVVFVGVSFGLIATEKSGWTCKNNVKELFSTPMGVVFKFRLSGKYSGSNGNTKFHSIQYELSKKRSRRKRKRFIIISGKFRIFPALDKNTNPEVNAFIFFSDLPSGRVAKYSDITSTINLTDRTINSLNKPNWNFNVNASGFSVNHLFPYKIISYRILIDTFEAITAININGGELIYKSSINEVLNQNLRTIGFFLEDNKRDSRCILEVSKPSCEEFDDFDELKKTSQQMNLEYSYGNLPDNLKRVQRSDNPDIQYTCAKKLIADGKELDLALKLLEKAAHNKHVLAMYQLGMCYFHGIGVEPDWDNAEKWLENAVKYRYQPACALKSMMSFYKTNFAPDMKTRLKRSSTLDLARGAKIRFLLKQ